MIETKLDKIAEIWNDFILNEEFFQRKINFDSEVETNYFGDILHYFYDSLILIKENIPEDDKDSFSASVFYAIGLLQIIFIQHDLVREFFYIFNIDKAEKKEFEKEIKRIRDLRNELIGHPINRNSKTGELRSTVFWGNRMSKNQIHYLKYTRKDNFKRGIQKEFSITQLIGNQEVVFKKYLNLILLNLKEYLREYLDNISQIEVSLNEGHDFFYLIDKIQNNCTLLWNKHIIFDKDILLECHTKKIDHPRYENTLEIFRNKLNYNIVNLRNRVYANLDEESKTVSFQNKNREIFKYSEELAHFLVRLFEKRQVKERITSLRDTFSDFPHILEELENMESNTENNTEYYSSYFYLTGVLLKKAVSHVKL
ncbi:hypothetical protein [uncultured Ilyobacter sp.]|uniref:hypothetical protein n=1 Tax=uncultured Ilyobacter sp. TaxID=544433 RepID=UPI0029F4B337|nr:hypothetical protein [uncultured Ilyobacter sp.]